MKQKCRDCKYLESELPRNGGRNCRFYCRHKNQQKIYDYFKLHYMVKTPGFVCYGGGLYGTEPTIKTSPAWCPLNGKE